MKEENRMRFINFISEEKVYLGIQLESGIVDVKKTAAVSGIDIPTSLDEVIRRGEKGIRQLEDMLKGAVSFISEDSIQYAPSVLNPGKILCVGLNYIEHGAECNMAIPQYPTLFNKFNNTLTAHNQVILVPDYIKDLDYEAELVIVIGKEAKNVAKKNALSYVFGYTIGNDFSSRDLQFRTSQWLLGKSCDNFAPIGPALVTADDIDPNNLNITCKVNGELRQSSNTKNMIFDCATIVSYISDYITLKPGDIIFTGTPSGVMYGYPKESRAYLKSNDQIQIDIENIGTLINTLK
jgi:2-keto-4-pentenoate hydratase/2-oxohepta-3-ene-1,7-dioic acid hydratase in catechol pathway